MRVSRLHLLLLEINLWKRIHSHTVSSGNSWPWQWYISMRRTAVWLVYTCLGCAHLCKCVRLHWDCLRVRQYVHIHKLISVNNSSEADSWNLLEQRPENLYQSYLFYLVIKICFRVWSSYSFCGLYATSNVDESGFTLLAFSFCNCV